ncbi:hypothetical protein BDQ12DRAFT_599616, partial [Crucibulum laeve]
VHFMASAILYYDHLITLGNEINYLWRRPKGASAYWFFSNRYLAFFGNLVVTDLGFTTLPLKRYVCKYFDTLVVIIWTKECTITASSWVPYRTIKRNVRFKFLISPITDDYLDLAGAWEALFVYDSIIFGFTIVKTWQTRREHAINGVSIPLISLILRDGDVMALANLANILTFYPFLRGGLSTFASSISVMMMSRLMLNLHESAGIGIFSTQLSNTGLEYGGTSGYNTTDIIELDTFWSDGVGEQSSLPPNISRIDEEPHPSTSITLTNVT